MAEPRRNVVAALSAHLRPAPHSAAAAAAAAAPHYDLVLTGGRVICPASGIDLEPCDVAVTAGAIAAVGPGLLAASVAGGAPAASSAEIYDARGMVVTPGLVDMHCHIYHLCTPLGEPADDVCIGRGVRHHNPRHGHHPRPGGIRASCRAHPQAPLLAVQLVTEMTMHP